MLDKVSVGNSELYFGDAFDLLDDVKFDSIITDPPYGINWAGHRASTLKWKKMSNDDGSLDLRPFTYREETVVMFGANNFPHQLPHRGMWDCWDKRGGNLNADRMLGSPFELIWYNWDHGTCKFYRIMHGGAINADGRGVKRVHPTQKPILLMEKLIENYTSEGDTIFDPFMGSGTTGVAAMRMNRKFIGCEIDPEHYATAVRRITDEVESAEANIGKA